MAQDEQVDEIGCRTCGLVQTVDALSPGTVAVCRRCGSRLKKRTPGALHITAALSLAALILYVPANIYPILELNMYGAVSENTVWDGCVRLFRDGDFVIAAVVFLASMLIPLMKLMGLFFLVGTVSDDAMEKIADLGLSRHRDGRAMGDAGCVCFGGAGFAGEVEAARDDYSGAGIVCVYMRGGADDSGVGGV